MNIPDPTPIYRMIHVDNLPVCLQRGGFHAPNYTPDDDLSYRAIHNIEIQKTRHIRTIQRGPGGSIHDYVAFYLGPRSPMLLQLYTGRVDGYNEGQEPLIYIISTVQDVQRRNLKFVFSNGHGLAAFTSWFDDVRDLDQVDWNSVYADYWADTLEDMDRQRRKQAEFLVHRFCPLAVVSEIGVFNQRIRSKVLSILGQYSETLTVNIRKKWYY
ncbi:MAG: DUF4433 domain-containing protein [Desulfobacterales bacterium]|nr:DUF4433 domain-containing protein [Desulfobacterales bacterium]